MPPIDDCESRYRVMALAQAHPRLTGLLFASRHNGADWPTILATLQQAIAEESGGLALPPAAARIAGAGAPAAAPRPQAPLSFRDVVEAASEAVVVTDADLDAPGPLIVYANPAFARMTGWQPADVLGQSPRVLQGPETDRKALRELAEKLRQGRPAQALVVNYTRSGRAYWCELRVSPLRDQDGRVTHFVAIERDVTGAAERTGKDGVDGPNGIDVPKCGLSEPA